MKLAKPIDPTIPWPEGRILHTTATIGDPLLHQQHTVMILIGGRRPDYTTINDSWIYDYTMKTWQQVYYYSTDCIITCILNSSTFPIR